MKISKLVLLLLVFSTSCKNKNSKKITMNENDKIEKKYRPSLHFSPAENWMNDPNGLVYYDDEYHLFYQYNPFGNTWGHMSWGHAVSKDLLHWEHLPIALQEKDSIMVFSGSAVVDWNNSSGFGTKENPPIVAIYTDYDAPKKLQYQSIAYSNDKGRTWTRYDKNPVIDLNMADFRDPKVFWYAPDEKWIMVVSVATDKILQFYSSKNLKEWKLMSEFGPFPNHDTSPNWECPDLFPITADDNTTKWVLEIDLGEGSFAGGSGGKYYIGDFDGNTFTSDYIENGVPQPFWVDFGKDFYAAVTWSDILTENKNKLWVGWMNNWQYAQKIPSGNWRSSMSIPRELSLSKVEDNYILTQKPVKTLDAHLKLEENFNVINAEKFNAELGKEKYTSFQYKIDIEFNVSEEDTLQFQFGDTETPSLIWEYNTNTQMLKMTRTKEGNETFDEKFPFEKSVKVASENDKLKVEIIVDKTSVEIFHQDGKVVTTNLIFPKSEFPKTSLKTSSTKKSIYQVTFYTFLKDE